MFSIKASGTSSKMQSLSDPEMVNLINILLFAVRPCSASETRGSNYGIICFDIPTKENVSFPAPVEHSFSTVSRP